VHLASERGGEDHSFDFQPAKGAYFHFSIIVLAVSRRLFKFSLIKKCFEL